jgi:hypothetical protein
MKIQSHLRRGSPDSAVGVVLHVNIDQGVRNKDVFHAYGIAAVYTDAHSQVLECGYPPDMLIMQYCYLSKQLI